MAKRGRKKDNPRTQAAKGHPGRRKSKVTRELEQMEKQAQRDAALFASAGTGFDLQALPVFLADTRLAAAQGVWKEYAPRLDRLHFLSTLDRYSFAMFCIYVAEFVLANKDILDKGYSIEVTTVAGSKMKKGATGASMLRTNPSADRRDFAAKMMLDLASKFGLTPLDRLTLVGKGARFDDETLFGRKAPAVPGPSATAEDVPDAPPQPAPAAPGGGLGVGGLGGLDGDPPKRMN